jgi:hypothetical protein
MKTTGQYGVRAQGNGRKADAGWKRPLSREQAWEQVKRFRADGGYSLIEVVDFDADKVVYSE